MWKLRQTSRLMPSRQSEAEALAQIMESVQCCPSWIKSWSMGLPDVTGYRPIQMWWVEPFDELKVGSRVVVPNRLGLMPRSCSVSLRIVGTTLIMKPDGPHILRVTESEVYLSIDTQEAKPSKRVMGILEEIDGRPYRHKVSGCDIFAPLVDEPVDDRL